MAAEYIPSYFIVLLQQHSRNLKYPHLCINHIPYVVEKGEKINLFKYCRKY